MRLFSKLLLAFFAVVLLAQLVLLLSAEALAPYTLKGHVANMVRMMGPVGLALRGELEGGLRSALALALLLSVPLTTLLSMGAAYLISRQFGKAVQFWPRGAGRSPGATTRSACLSFPGGMSFPSWLRASTGWPRP